MNIKAIIGGLGFLAIGLAKYNKPVFLSKILFLEGTWSPMFYKYGPEKGPRLVKWFGKGFIFVGIATVIFGLIF
ncbi:MAG TPA: hypothetical protein VJB12_03750 [Candidatus Nanoarchaeia archaeon]|nr:hypothetical protein [Candidatus Nanoarchaeia archaeon]